jgi:acyl-CoA hydrolase
VGERHCSSVDSAVDRVIEQVGNQIVLGIPLGLGKPNQFVNALYQRVKQQPDLKLTIYTALTLERPIPAAGLEARFAQPLYDRIFGNYDDFKYALDRRNGSLPENVEVYEFFYKSGSLVGNSYAQQRYISTNYTHAPRDIFSRGVNVLAQMIACREENGQKQYSLSCNPEVSLDILKYFNAHSIDRPLVVGQVHDQLPFMVNDAQIDGELFDLIIDNPQYNTTLFAPPNMPVTTTEYMIGLQVSSLIADGGTLQIGIGSLGDAIVYASEYRHLYSDHYHQILKDLQVTEKSGDLIDSIGGIEPFKEGLYGNSEMFVDGFYYLMKAGILKRRVYDSVGIQRLINEKKITEEVSLAMLDTLIADDLVSARPDKKDIEFLKRFGILKQGLELSGDHLICSDNKGTANKELAADFNNEETRQYLQEFGLGSHLCGGKVMHGGFFLGPESFYEGLRQLSADELAAINMTNISYVNQLYGDEEIKRAQRQKARFANTVFTINLLGAATSDGLPDGQVVSGVGGQYNFVAQAHELEGARSILMVKATRTKGGKVASNIVWNYAHTTIPRHLRDIYVSEYGIADVRGKSDDEVIKALLNIADSRFQSGLLEQAKAAGKIAANYEIPVLYRNNFPQKLTQIFAKYQRDDEFPVFPFGTDFTDEELQLGRALKQLQAAASTHRGKLRLLSGALLKNKSGKKQAALLKRMGLDNPGTFQERLQRALLLTVLEH